MAVIDENLEYYLGNHFRFWVGPTVAATDPGYNEKMALLRRVFQQANILRECSHNWRDGLVSEPFRWHLKGVDGKRTDPQADATAAEAELQLQRWLDWVDQQAIEADPLSTNFRQADPWSEFVLSLGVLGKAALRLWQPERYAEAADPIQRIHLHAPKATAVTIARSADGFVDSLTYSWSSSANEKHTLEGAETVVATDKAEPLRLQTGGRWLIQVAEAQPLFTPSVKALQNSINHALTMKLRNNETAGFRERVFLNADMPPEDITRGPGQDLYLYGPPQGDPSNPTYANASMVESEPVDVSNLVKSIEIDRTLIYLELHQGHLLGAGDGGLSGESRIQMRQGFELSLRGYRRRIEAVIANVLNIVLGLLGYEQYEVVVQLQITTGKLSAEEQAAVIAQHQAGLKSRATAMAELGIDDPDAEAALIDEEMGISARSQPNGVLGGELPNPLNGAGDNGNGG